MKVMVVCTTGGSGRRQLGGAERILTELLPALAARDLDIVACTPDDEVGQALREAGVPWRNLAARSRVDPGYAREIWRTAHEVSPDVVCAHLLSAAMHARAALAVERHRTPLVVTLHNSLWQYRETAPSWRQKASVQANITLDLVMRRLRPHTSVAVSEFEAGELRDRGRVRNLHVIRNPLPARWPAPTAIRDTLSGGTPRIGFMGRLEREKGADLIASIAARLPDYRFVVAGAGSLPIPQQSNVELVGHVDAAGFLRRVDCLVVPSRVESFGLSALEALSLGVPVVHSGAGGLAEVTQRADGVLAFRADLTAEAMAASVRRAVTVPADCRPPLATWYSAQFSFARCVDRWHDLYRSLVA